MATPKVSLPGELWKEIPGLETRYSASNLGRIYNQRTEHILSPVFQKRNGYLNVYINAGDKGKTMRAHRLIALTFCPMSEGKASVNHINGIKTDNRSENLEWCSSAENIIHALRTGLKVTKKGEQSHASKLSKHQVANIKERFENGESQSAIARDYQLSQSTISLLVRNKRWTI